MSTILILISVMFISGLMSFVLSWNHILSTLIAMEFMALSLFFTLNSVSAETWTESFYALIYLAVAVCEGALGLSILVAASQQTGNDLFSSMNTLSW
uniref:NADH-ubiquinone oxidoreductase chain 4L n=1 Tax=Ligia oceanica TaxID=96856 RepID=Q09TF3_LIGOC|nr:NADH dehydrogenase subunit 4L [Ligia oceanica]